VTTTFSFTLNGARVDVTGVDPNTTLLAWLRLRGLTGTKESCAEGECGACAVAFVVAAGTEKSRLVAVNSCLVLLPEVAGGEVWTVEGLAARDGTLHPVQRTMVEQQASQCGYCTPGFVMSLFANFHAQPRLPARDAIAGNLCRCTGYRPILAAAAALPAVANDDVHADRLRRPAPPLDAVEYEADGVPFFRPTRLDDALAHRAAHPDATVLAGGTDLVVETNQDGRRRSRVLSLGGIAELQRIEERDGTWSIGAMATWDRIAREIGDRVPLLAQLGPLFASPLIRARGTLGGNLVTASPVGDGAPVLLALDAELDVASARARRVVSIAEWFTGYRKCALRPDELLVTIRVPAAPPTASRFFKVSKRELDDISSVAGALAVWRDGSGVVTKARFAFGGVADRPRRAIAAENALVGGTMDATSLAAVQQAASAEFTPMSDVRASAAYRTAMIGSLLAKFWHEVAR